MLHTNTLEAYKLFHDGIFALSRMEQHGMRITVKYVEKTISKLETDIAELESKFKKTKFYKQWQNFDKGTINIYSPDQLGKYLYISLKIRIPKTTKSGKGAIDEDALHQLKIPELDLLLEAKKLKKLKDTYLVSFLREQVDGYIHPFFNLHLVRTFRGSADSPNVQNIPKRNEEYMQIVRKAIMPSKGHQLLELDYSQLEVRISACYHKDPTMIRYIKDPSTDMHRDVAQQIFFIKNFNKEIPSHKNIRFITKSFFIFAQFYGDYYKNCAANIVKQCNLPKAGKFKSGQGIEFEEKHISDQLISNGITTYEKFEEHLKVIEKDFWEIRFPVYAKWKESWWIEYQKNGYIYSKTGFTYQGLMNKKEVINYPVQGAAFHCLLYSLIEGVKAQTREKWKSRIVGQIHDAIIIDLHPDEFDEVTKVMKCIMCNDVVQHFNWINVPLDVEADLGEIDKSWATVKPVKI